MDPRCISDPDPEHFLLVAPNPSNRFKPWAVKRREPPWKRSARQQVRNLCGVRKPLRVRLLHRKSPHTRRLTGAESTRPSGPVGKKLPSGSAFISSTADHCALR
ncbi:hypothetical protein CesoFtcFv8_012012 [Champsocephalus esox]|uniref:Uncharacterized protein n=2 Tax=Champsocephalus TaxID=52236 RepID=A0AAN8DLG5_CHAGU|nr:hypothetical protein CesoFtcFv8_012012 [Champsocephalus esox]KAK5924437.1 hypothetical protein CgunFtcFv8_001303 [Champsocephalus gunnari]